jgi:hypothetical protein
VLVNRIISSLELPESALIHQRVPKTILTERVAPTAADRRRIKDNIEGLFWIAALKSNTIGVPIFRDEKREYLEIAVIHVLFRSQNTSSRLIELIHRSIPYPVFLIAESEGGLSLSLAHKRWSQNEIDKMVLEEGYPHVTEIRPDDPDIFFQSLSLSCQPRTDMFALYHGWLDKVIALDVARLTGNFRVASRLESPDERCAVLAHIGELEAEIARLRKAAAREKQIARQVELNLKIKQMELERNELLRQLAN